jgi:uncharacterized protein (DUF1015 family)
MARLEPFAGIRYSSTEGPLDDLVAPPYDVVDEQGRAELAARSPRNAILVELPEADAERGLDRYANAARIFESWLADGTLATDRDAAFYVYRMSFRDESGAPRVTTGVIGALAVDADGRGDVLPHEQTMPKPKGDRLFLLRATRANLSPIWGLSLTSGLAKVCEDAVAGTPAPARADVEDVVHELWPVSDPQVSADITRLVGETPVLIADGHHRYETALAYRQERREVHGDAGGDYDRVMALIVELAEDELFVRPIHRLVAGLPAGFDLPAALAAYFAVESSPPGPGLTTAMAEAGTLGLVTPAGSFLLTPLPATDAAAGADLDSVRVDVALASLPPHELAYQHGTAEAAAAVTKGLADAAFLLRPAGVSQIAETAHGGRRMPPKTTFFYPKPRTGMVFRRVED